LIKIAGIHRYWLGEFEFKILLGTFV